MGFNGYLDALLLKGRSIRLFDLHNNEVYATVINSESFLNKNGQRRVRFSAEVDVGMNPIVMDPMVATRTLFDLMNMDNIRNRNVMLKTDSGKEFRLIDGLLHSGGPRSAFVVSGNLAFVHEDITKDISEEKEGELSRWEMMDLD